jgi:hypothetical protein
MHSTRNVTFSKHDTYNCMYSTRNVTFSKHDTYNCMYRTHSEVSCLENVTLRCTIHKIVGIVFRECHATCTVHTIVGIMFGECYVTRTMHQISLSVRMRNLKLRNIRPSGAFWPEVTLWNVTRSDVHTCIRKHRRWKPLLKALIKWRERGK